MHNYTILCGADIDDYNWLNNQITNDDFIICADSGLRHAHAINVKPNIIIGDFDSVCPELLNGYKGICDIIHDDDQNSTDLMKALTITNKRHSELVSESSDKKNQILKQVQDDALINIYGANGQRADHDFSVLLVLMNTDNPDTIALCTPHDTRRVIKSSITINGAIGDKIGIFPLQPIQNITVSGLKYAPEILGGPYDLGWNGACNEMITPSFTININSGCALITHSVTV